MESSTSWETSYFGGYYKVLYDYPEIKVPYKIDVDIPTSKLGYYTSNKLISIFLLKIKEHELMDTFLRGSKVEEITKWGQKQKKLFVNKSSITNVLDAVIANDTELSNLFKHYRDIVIDTKFSFPVPEEGEGKCKDKKKGEGEGEGEGEAAKKAAAKEHKMSCMSAMALLDAVTNPKVQWADQEGSIGGDLTNNTKWRLMNGTTSCKFTDSHLRNAKMLSNLLDISFDPQSDKVSGLKVGKLDSKKIAEVMGGNFHIYYTEQENQTTKPFSVCILMDESGSMGGIDHAYSGKGNTQQDLVKILWKTFSDILPPEKIFIYGHSSVVVGGTEVPEIRVYNDKYNHIFEKAITRQKSNAWHNNYDGPVIESVYNKVRSFTEDNIIFIAISDGMPSGSSYGGTNAIREMKTVIEKCKRDGFVTVGVGIELGQIKEIYNYHTVVTDLNNTAKQVSTLINKVVKTEFQS